KVTKKSRQHSKKSTQLAVKAFLKEHSQGHNNIIRFIGISLAGGKSDKACVAVLEYYPDNKKVFLSRIFEKIKSDEQISGDLKIHELVFQNAETLKYVAFDTPWNVPSCLRCKLKCPGFESCREPHIEWMWKHQEDRQQKKRPKKLFTPYTQRAIELYFLTELEETFHLQHAMGANTAPLLARSHFIQRRLPFECIEVYPHLSLWRIGKALGLMSSQIKDHRAAFGGDESRAKFIQALNEKNIAFIYHQDAKSMIENNHAFEAFICGLTAFLKYKNLTQKKPKDFPEYEDWIEFPIHGLKLD
ncbi:MAG: DUF429 domain-containing protein, partial [Pseudobdellovibrio sp.]